MNRSTAAEHATIGFFQAIGWMLGTVVVGAAFYVVVHHPVGLACGLLVPAVLVWRRVGRRQYVEIYPLQKTIDRDTPEARPFDRARADP